MAKEQLIETVADEIDKVAEGVEEVAEVTRRLTGRELGFFTVGASLGIAAGFGVGYFFMTKRVETKYSKIADAEIAEMREHYQKLQVALQGEVERRRPLEELVVEKGYSETNVMKVDVTESPLKVELDETRTRPYHRVETNTSNDPEVDMSWDYAIEIKSRDPLVPYIIHIDEFRQNEPDHTQITVTYYEVDDVLADVRDTPIEDMDETIGLGNLGRWGHGSNDEHIVYVRNEYLKLDYEIVRDRGSFQDQTTRQMRHSHERRRRPNRKFDDD